MRKQPNLEDHGGFSPWSDFTADLVKEGDELGKDTWIRYKTDLSEAFHGVWCWQEGYRVIWVGEFVCG